MFAQSLLRLQRVDVGFNATNLLTFDVMLTGERAEYQAKQLDFFNRFLERVRALPGVVNAAGAVTLPISGLAITANDHPPVYASDDNTFTLTSSGNTKIGWVRRWVSTGVAVVEFDAFAVL